MICGCGDRNDGEEEEEERGKEEEAAEGEETGKEEREETEWGTDEEEGLDVWFVLKMDWRESRPDVG